MKLQKTRKKGIKNMKMTITDESYKLVQKIPFEEPNVLQKIVAARRQEAAFQIVLFPNEECDLNLDTEPRIYGGRARPVYRLEVICKYEALLESEGMLCDDAGIYRADILGRDRKMELKAVAPAAVWAEIKIPEDAEPGHYQVLIKLWRAQGNQDEELFAEKEVELEILGYCMPKPEEYYFRLDLWQHVSNVARQFSVPLFGEKHFEILREMVKSLAQLGQKSVTVVASDSPWRGWECWKNIRSEAELYEYSMIGTIKKKDGSFVYDYRVMQRYIDLCREYGISDEIEVFGLVNIWRLTEFDRKELCEEYPENILIRYFDEEKGSFGYLRRKEEICSYITALEQYFIRTGQIDRVRVAADEPADFERYKKSLALMREIAPAFRYKTAFDHAEFMEHLEEGITALAPNFYCVCSCYDKMLELKQKNPEFRYQWYICCGPEYPNTFLDSGLLEARFVAILNSIFGFEGLLRWAYTCWTKNAAEDIRYGDWRAGDLCLVYPSRSGGILKSLRWKGLKRGIEDYELLERLRQQEKVDVIKKVLELLLKEKDVHRFLKETREVREIFVNDYEIFEKARRLMLEALEQA